MALTGEYRTVSLLTGPEGGLEEKEVRQAREAGLQVCTLGRRILRCETAPLCACPRSCMTRESSDVDKCRGTVEPFPGKMLFVILLVVIGIRMVVMGGIGTVRGGAKGVIGIVVMGGIGTAGNGAGLGCGGLDRLQNGHVGRSWRLLRSCSVRRRRRSSCFSLRWGSRRKSRCSWRPD